MVNFSSSQRGPYIRYLRYHFRGDLSNRLDFVVKPLNYVVFPSILFSFVADGRETPSCPQILNWNTQSLNEAEFSRTTDHRPLIPFPTQCLYN